jgi:hypothetical protein
MDLYLHAKSEHHPPQKQAMLKTLIQQARTICNAESLDKEINHLRWTFRQNGIATLVLNGLSFQNRDYRYNRRSRQA